MYHYRTFVHPIILYFLIPTGPSGGIGPTPGGNCSAPSSLSFFNCCSRWYSITRLCLKCVIYHPQVSFGSSIEPHPRHGSLAATAFVQLPNPPKPFQLSYLPSPRLLCFSELLDVYRELTQLLAQFPASSCPSFEHAFSASSLFLIESTMPCLSRHAKYVSLASQHFCLAERSGAIGVPSVDTFGGGMEEGVVEPNKPIVVYVY